MIKDQLIALVQPAISKRTGESIANVRASLECVSLAELEDMYRRQLATGLIEAQIQQAPQEA